MTRTANTLTFYINMQQLCKYFYRHSGTGVFTYIYMHACTYKLYGTYKTHENILKPRHLPE